MPSKDAERAADARSQERRLTRRSLLQGAATAGAAGLAVTAMGAAAGPALAASPAAGGGGLPAPDHVPAGPIVVHVRDARSGDIEVFSGTSQARLRDKNLAARIAGAIGGN